MKKILQKKICSQAGESLAETLVAVLVIAVASVLLAGMITATNRIVRTSTEKLDAYYIANMPLETFSSSEDGSPITISVQESNPGTNPISFNIADVPVSYAKNPTFSNTPVIAYRKQ